MGRGRNLAKPEGIVEESDRSGLEIQLDEFIQENVLPVIGKIQYAKMLDLIDGYGKASYGRGYVQGGRDERRH
jgi:hypothetical protein